MVRSSNDWPDWWEWELDLWLDHLREQMIRRKFNETELREMLDQTKSLRQSEEFGRWIAETTKDQQPWEVVIEPQIAEQVLLVITAYKVQAL